MSKSITLDDFCNIVNIFMGERDPNFRLGQWAFCVLHEEFPDIARQITASPVDPFYDDKKIPKFLIYLLTLIEE